MLQKVSIGLEIISPSYWSISQGYLTSIRFAIVMIFLKMKVTNIMRMMPISMVEIVPAKSFRILIMRGFRIFIAIHIIGSIGFLLKMIKKVLPLWICHIITLSKWFVIGGLSAGKAEIFLRYSLGMIIIKIFNWVITRKIQWNTFSNWSRINWRRRKLYRVTARICFNWWIRAIFMYRQERR